MINQIPLRKNQKRRQTRKIMLPLKQRVKRRNRLNLLKINLTMMISSWHYQLMMMLKIRPKLQMRRRPLDLVKPTKLRLLNPKSKELNHKINLPMYK